MIARATCSCDLLILELILEGGDCVTAFSASRLRERQIESGKVFQYHLGFSSGRELRSEPGARGEYL